ncbi:MAG: Gldg family protein [Planctomycetes bacterium]|nr:Gldg family protein [Planctomycetota bacterium]
MNLNIVRAVWKRDLASWFGNPTGYVFIILFVLFCCGALMFSSAFFANNLANLDTLNDPWFPLLAIVFVSASTMNIWASERSNGTHELLFTLPGTDLDLQFGKFLAAVSVYTVSLLFTLVMPIALMMLGNPDMGQLFANYLGFWLFGVMLVAISMVGSQLTQNGTVALIVSILLCAAVVYFGEVAGWLGFLSWQTNGPIGQFELFAGMKVPFSGVVLFVGVTVAFFYLGLALLARRHWRDGSQGVHSAVRFGSLAVCAFAATIVGVQVLPRIDATVEGIHSLGDETEKLLADLDRDKPVYITAFVSEQVPEQFVQQKKLLLNLLDQFDAIGGAAVEKQIVIPEPYSPEARQAESEFGIRPQHVTVPLPGGGMADLQMYLGFAVQCGTNEVVTPFVGPAVPLEYELMRSIRTVSNANRRTVGILKTDVELFGGFDMQTFQQKPRWAIAQELEQQYDIENVDPTTDYPDGLDCLIVPQPSSLEQEPMDRLQQWILAGNPTILFEDPQPLGAPGTAADEPKGGQQARMMGGGGPPKGNWSGFQSALGLSAPVGEIVWDLSYRTFPGGRINQEIVFVREPGMADDSPITSGLQSVVSMFGGYVEPTDKEGVTFTPLLQSVGPATTRETNGIVKKSELFQQSFFGGPQLNPYARRERRNDDLTIAARLVGKPAEGQDQGLNLIYVADLDMIGNQFFQLRSQVLDPNVRFDNVTFALNCIDTLVGDESLIELRKRRPILRKLTAVEEAQREFEDEWQREKEAAEEAAKESLDKAQQRLDDAVAKIREDDTLDAQAKEVKIVEVQQNENRKFELEKAQIEDRKKRRLEEAQHDRDAARSGIHDRYRLITLLLAAIPGLLLGLFTYLRRTMRASSIIPDNRLVGGSN